MDTDDDIPDDFEWFDGWCEAHFYLLEQKNYPALVECCEQRLKRDPDDPYAVEALAQAYILNGQPQSTLDLVTPYYEHEPDHPLYQVCVLDALVAMGRGINDFAWRSPPDVLRISDGVLDECHRFLKPKRKPRTVSELYTNFLIKAYLLFSEEELLAELAKDDRFVVRNRHEGISTEVSVARKRTGRQAEGLHPPP